MQTPDKLTDGRFCLYIVRLDTLEHSVLNLYKIELNNFNAHNLRSIIIILLPVQVAI